MAGRVSAGVLAIWIVVAMVLIGSVAAMGWMWRSGGVRLPAPGQANYVEECNAVIAGSTAMGARLMPEAVAAFLTRSGYTLEPGATPNANGVQIVGIRENFRCTVTVRANTSTGGFHDLAEGRALIAMTQRPITQNDVARLRAAGAGDFGEQRASAEYVIGFDVYSVVVANDNPVRAISLDDARDVALGLITNWSVLGGGDNDIEVYAAIDGVGPEDYPNDIIQRPNQDWDNARERARTHVFATETEAAAALAQDPDGIAFISGAFAGGDSGVRALDVSVGGPAQAATPENVRREVYPLARRLFLYVRPADVETSAFASRFVAFMTSPGAFDVIDGAGFAALRPESRLSRNASRLAGCRWGTPEYSALMTVTNNAERLPVELHFEANTLALDATARAYVAQNAAALAARARAGDTIIAIGHTDVSGDLARNRQLALRRAIAVRETLEAVGVFGVVVESAGEHCPAGDNQTEDGRERNRRVELWARPAS
jgi:phosphate transport system substrate-binding protein